MIFNGSSRNKIPWLLRTQVPVCKIPLAPQSWSVDLRDISFHGLLCQSARPWGEAPMTGALVCLEIWKLPLYEQVFAVDTSNRNNILPERRNLYFKQTLNIIWKIENRMLCIYIYICCILSFFSTYCIYRFSCVSLCWFVVFLITLSDFFIFTVCFIGRATFVIQCILISI